MKLVEAKCPNCGGVVKVNKDKTTACCKYCRSKFIIDEENKKSEHEVLINTQHLLNEIERKNQINVKYILAGISVFACLIAFIVYLDYVEDHEEVIESHNEINIQEQYNAYINNYCQPISQDKEEIEEISLEMQAIQKLIFKKPIENITEDDLGKLCYIKVETSWNSDIETIFYSFEDYYSTEDPEAYMKNLKSIQIDQSIYEEDYDSENKSKLDSKDFECFKNLTYIEYNGLSQDTIAKLSKLKGIKGFNGTLSELEKVVNPLTIVELSLGYNVESIDKIGDFSNLQVLEIKDTEITHIEPILE